MGNGNGELRGSRKPRKIDVIKEQSRIIYELQEMVKLQGSIIIELKKQIK